MSEPSTGDICDCKVGRQQQRHGLEKLNEEVLTRRRDAGSSLRDLARFVNTRILEAAMEAANADVTGDARSVYETLTGDDVAPERVADLTDQLEFVGIDVEDLRGDFVSHQTVKGHLNDCLDVDTARSGVESIAEGRSQIQWSRDRYRTVLENTIDQLVRADALSVGDFEVSDSVSITCTDCNRSYRLEEFMDRQHCECEWEDSNPTD